MLAEDSEESENSAQPYYFWEDFLNSNNGHMIVIGKRLQWKAQVMLEEGP